MLDYLSPGHLRPSASLTPGVGRVLQRLLKGGKSSHQFKIEPLLNREAPTVEVTKCVKIINTNNYFSRFIIYNFLMSGSLTNT